MAEKCEDYDWKGFARYNWGTDVPREVNRWLAETIGIKTIDANDPSKTVLKPADGMAAEVLIPKPWKQEGLVVDKLYTVAVRKRLPPVAVGISKLDKWFIPESESCDFKYELEGLEECADKVQFQVFASNYCKAEATAEGTDFLKYKFTAVDVPVYEEEIAEPKARTSNSQTGWKGKSNAADGVFKPRDAQDRYIDASQSPYTIHLRYFKDAADAQARIDLNPFWPLFEDGKPKAETLKVEWEIKDTSRLKYGRIQIFDKDGLIFEAPLPEAKLGQGKQSFEWDGKHTDGATEMKAENMPYRAQIQGHTGPDEKKGLALAAMQTEVRLFVHAELGTHPDKPWEDPQCLQFALAPCLPYRDKVADAPAKGSDQWYKWKLAQCGFHPGPAGADAVGDDFTNALKEFQRSYPKKGAAPHSRIKADGSKNADTQNALDDLAEGARAMFGKTSDLDDYTAAQAIARLIKPDKDMVVWAEDRHCYTAGAWKPAPAKFTTATYDMEDYRGGMSIGDNRPVRDAASVPRPWIPLEAYPALLSKSKPLEATAAMPAVTEQMRRAAGPLRVDWTFEEIGPQTDLIPDPAKRDAVNVVLSNAAYGSFRLGYDGGNTADIPWNATTAAFTNALSNMAKIQGNKNRKKKVSVSGPDGGPWQIAFESGFVGPSVTTVTADGSALRGTDTDVKRVYTPGAGARKWTVTITGATGGTFKLSCDGQESGDIPYNADGDALRTILVQVPKIASGNKGPERTEVTGSAGGPWEVKIKGGTFGGVLVSNLTMNAGGLQPQATVTVTAEQMEVTRSKAFVKEIIEKETSAYTAKDGEKLLTNCPEKVHGVNCGIRPATVAEYYKAPFGRDKTHSLLPWLAAADAAEKVVLTYMHADLGQDEAKVYPDFLGKAGVYLRPSRIAGDGYRFRAQISFKKDPGGADHPNREVLEKRYPKLPQANTAKMRVWRKASFRAYIGWVKTVEANWGQAMTDAANHYKPAHVHFVHEGPNPKTPQSFPAKGVDKIVTDAEFKDLIKERLAGSPYDAIKNDAKLEGGIRVAVYPQAAFRRGPSGRKLGLVRQLAVRDHRGNVVGPVLEGADPPDHHEDRERSRPDARACHGGIRQFSPGGGGGIHLR